MKIPKINTTDDNTDCIIESEQKTQPPMTIMSESQCLEELINDKNQAKIKTTKRPNEQLLPTKKAKLESIIDQHVQKGILKENSEVESKRLEELLLKQVLEARKGQTEEVNKNRVRSESATADETNATVKYALEKQQIDIKTRSALLAFRSLATKKNRLISIQMGLNKQLSEQQIRTQVREFEIKQAWNEQRYAKIWTSAKQNATFIEFSFHNDMNKFVNDPVNEKLVKAIYNHRDPGAFHFARKPIRFLLWVSKSLDIKIVENNIRLATLDINDFYLTQPNAQRNQVRMALFSTSEIGFRNLAKMDWSIPYTMPSNGKTIKLKVKIDATIKRCRLCFELMGSKGHKCNGERCLYCNEFGHDKRKCQLKETKGCAICNYSLPRHNALSPKCPKYIQKAFDTVSQMDIPKEYLINDKNRLIKDNIMELINNTHMT